MEGAFRVDSKLFRAVDKLLALVKLNLIWMCFCIPIFTIGAANCALHEVASQIEGGNEGYIFKSFVSTFKKKFRHSTLIFLPVLIIGAGIYLDYHFWSQMTGTFAGVMKGMVIALAVVYLFLSVYLYPLMARMDTGLKKTVRNAALLAFKYLPQTLYLVLWLGILWIVGKIWAMGLFVTIMLGASTVAVLHAKVLKKIFLKEGIIEE